MFRKPCKSIVVGSNYDVKDTFQWPLLVLFLIVLPPNFPSVTRYTNSTFKIYLYLTTHVHFHHHHHLVKATDNLSAGLLQQPPNCSFCLFLYQSGVRCTYKKNTLTILSKQRFIKDKGAQFIYCFSFIVELMEVKEGGTQS